MRARQKATPKVRARVEMPRSLAKRAEAGKTATVTASVKGAPDHALRHCWAGGRGEKRSGNRTLLGARQVPPRHTTLCGMPCSRMKRRVRQRQPLGEGLVEMEQLLSECRRGGKITMGARGKKRGKSCTAVPLGGEKGSLLVPWTLRARSLPSSLSLCRCSGRAICSCPSTGVNFFFCERILAHILFVHACMTSLSALAESTRVGSAVWECKPTSGARWRMKPPPGLILLSAGGSGLRKMRRINACRVLQPQRMWSR